jgi:hypothetical protein
VCRDVGCRTAAHRSNKATLGCDTAYCIPAAQPKVFGSTSCAFLHPMLDSSRLVESVKASLEDRSFERTTREWEAFIALAILEYDKELAVGRQDEKSEASSAADDSSDEDDGFDLPPCSSGRWLLTVSRSRISWAARRTTTTTQRSTPGGFESRKFTLPSRSSPLH